MKHLFKGKLIKGLRRVALLCCCCMLIGSIAPMTMQSGVVSAYAAESGVSGFVSRLYTQILERTPEEEGLNFWVSELQAGRQTGVKVAEGFIMSPEFLAKDLTNEAFVQIMYKTFFDREADEGGFAYWTDVLSHGDSKWSVFAGFANSKEFGELCESYGIEQGSIVAPTPTPEPTPTPLPEPNVSQFVERLYRETLGREADADGLAFWVGELKSGSKTGTKVAEGFILSDEFITKDMTDGEFVQIMYRTFFGREADADGFRYWTGELGKDKSKRFVFAGFANSDEFGELCEEYDIIQGSVENGLEPTPVPDPSTEGKTEIIPGVLEMVSKSLEEQLKKSYIDFWTYSADVAYVSQFETAEGGYGVAYHGEEKITILLYDKVLNLQETVQIEAEEAEVGAVSCDENGLFYVVYGITNATDDVSKDVMHVVKYSSTGKKLASVSYTGDETGWSGISQSSQNSGSGTKIPFRASNCSIAVSNGMLVCTYGRQMYNGHQASNSLYVETESMEKIDINPVYTSHSFDQQVIPVWDGGYLFADHGDAFGRSFTVSKLQKGGTNIAYAYELESFHFREGSNRGYGYNETYAQLGGIAELPNSYVLVGASERTLSLGTAPTNREYCGYSEPRDLFIQYLKKDYGEYYGADCYAVEGETRTATGSHSADALTNLYLSEDVEDYGVIWLTDYTGEEMVYNPKVATTEAGEVVLIWNKTLFSTEEIENTYYMVLDSEGNIVKDICAIGKIPLSKNEPVVCIDGSVYWSVTEGNELNTYRLIISEGGIGRLENDVTWRVFDAEYYLEQYPWLENEVGTKEQDLYLYWINVGIYLGHSATSVLVPVEYMLLNPEVAAEVDYDHTEAVRHFFEEGIYKGLCGSREFNYAVYTEYNPDLSAMYSNDTLSYYEHYVKYGKKEGRTASLYNGEEEPETLGEMIVVPEGTKKFMTPDGRIVAMVFSDNRMVAQKYYDSMGVLEKRLSYYYYDDPENTYYIKDASNYKILVWHTEYEDGTEKWKAEDGSEGGFEYVNIVSENGDGTITVCLKEVKDGVFAEWCYYETGIINSIEQSVYAEEGTWQTTVYYYNESGIVTEWTLQEYVNSKKKVSAWYEGEGTSKLSKYYEYDENGLLLSVTYYYYNESGKLEYYCTDYYEDGRWIQRVKYDPYGNIIS